MTVRPRPALDSSLDFGALAASSRTRSWSPEKASQDEALMDALDIERHR
jgi:hypothetical protein